MPEISFGEAVKASGVLGGCLCPGMQALKSNSSRISFGDTRLIEGSVDLDSCTQPLYPTSHRWDYMIGYNGELVMVEVHRAETSEVDELIAKKNWAVQLLGQCGHQLASRTRSFHWVATSGVHILPNSKQARLLAKSGISGPMKFLQVS